MKSDRPREGWFERLMRWAEGGEPDLSQEVAEDPERAEFLEYLQYLESHTYMEFGAYRLMRLKERADRGELPGSRRDTGRRSLPSAPPGGGATGRAACGGWSGSTAFCQWGWRR